MARNVVAVRKWGNSRVVVIPRFVMREMKWKMGQVIWIAMEGDHIVLRPIEYPKGVVPDADSEIDSPRPRRTQPDSGTGVAGSL